VGKNGRRDARQLILTPTLDVTVLSSCPCSQNEGNGATEKKKIKEKKKAERGRRRNHAREKGEERKQNRANEG
jgi:hypothetical protein